MFTGALVRRNVAHVLAVDQDVALGRHFEAGEHAQQRGLAAARGPEQREELSRLDVEADIVDRRPWSPIACEMLRKLMMGLTAASAPLGFAWSTVLILYPFFCALPCITIIRAMSTMVSTISMVDAALTSGVTEKRSIE